MKQYTSRALKIVALGYMAFPALYLVLVALLFDIPASQCVRVLLSPTYYLLSFLAVLVGYGLWEMKRWAWYVFLLVNILIGYTNAILVSNFGETHHKIIAFAVSVVALLVLILRVSKEVRVPYFLPKIRWWESNPRYRLVVPVQITRVGTHLFDGEILDLSMGGCFIKTRADLMQDEKIDLKFRVFGQELKLPGTVVWRTLSTVTHPRGVGIKFLPLPKFERRLLKVINHRLKKIAAFYRSSRYLMSQDEFFKKFEELQNSNIDLRRKQRAIKSNESSS